MSATERMYQYSEPHLLHMMTSVALAAQAMSHDLCITVEATGDYAKPFVIVGTTRVELPIRWPGAEC
jgi:hypothetical protein